MNSTLGATLPQQVPNVGARSVEHELHTPPRTQAVCQFEETTGNFRQERETKSHTRRVPLGNESPATDAPWIPSVQAFCDRG